MCEKIRLVGMDKIRLHIRQFWRGFILPPLSVISFSPFIVYGFIIYFVLLPISIFHIRLSSLFYKHALNISIGLDQFASASTHGNPDQTISGRLGYAIYYKGKDLFIFVILCKILNKFFRQSNHCKDAIEFDRL